MNGIVNDLATLHVTGATLVVLFGLCALFALAAITLVVIGIARFSRWLYLWLHLAKSRKKSAAKGPTATSLPGGNVSADTHIVATPYGSHVFKTPPKKLDYQKPERPVEEQVPVSELDPNTVESVFSPGVTVAISDAVAHQNLFNEHRNTCRGCGGTYHPSSYTSQILTYRETPQFGHLFSECPGCGKVSMISEEWILRIAIRNGVPIKIDAPKAPSHVKNQAKSFWVNEKSATALQSEIHQSALKAEAEENAAKQYSSNPPNRPDPSTR